MDNWLKAPEKWKNRISNHSQLGGIEISELIDGNGRKCRVAWFNTGGGLRFKVVLDRAMDIGEAFYNSYSLAWVSHLGTSAPNPAIDFSSNWAAGFGGGMLVTCGLTHTGGGETEDGEVRGLHGSISQMPAALESVVQPDPAKGRMEMSITGKMIETSLFGPTLELRRTISAELGSPVIKIRDEVTNLGNMAAPHMLLYHMNFGWPLVDEGTELFWEGKTRSRGDQEMDDKIFAPANNYKKCTSPSADFEGERSAVGFIDTGSDGEGYCRCGLQNSLLGLRLTIKYRKEQLPWLANWQHFAEKEYVTALEPCTSPPVGQKAARENGTLVHIRPGEVRTYEMEIAIDEVLI